ncbi:hypothetical protein FV230_17590 [Methylobacterium sp. WL6]|nr:hypothetical protein FV230_17590 [Methylobacterium sp. WL6]
MLIHFFEPDTGDFLRSVEMPTVRDRIGTVLTPAGGTLAAPPLTTVGFRPRWADGEWVILPDHRGEVWYAPEGRPVSIHKLGDPADDGLVSNPPPEMLARAKDAACTAIDVAAEAARLRVMTPGAGQAMEYARALDQAKGVLAADEPSPADFPLVAAADASASDLIEGARAIVVGAERTDAALAVIRTRRLAGKTAVRAATTLPEIHAAGAAVVFA